MATQTSWMHVHGSHHTHWTALQSQVAAQYYHIPGEIIPLHQTKILNRDTGIQTEWKCSNADVQGDQFGYISET